MRTPKQRTLVGWLALVCYAGTILGANWAISRIGMVPVGFGLAAPAGVYCVGLAFTFRDIVQNTMGRAPSLAAIVVGAALSAIVSPHFALASAGAALCGELADFCVYTPLYRQGWIRALVPANLAGVCVDSALFLWLAFGTLHFVEGQILGKTWMTALAVAVLLPVRRWYALTPVPVVAVHVALPVPGR